MKTTSKILTIAICVLGFAMVSCQEEEIVVKTNDQLLTENNWRETQTEVEVRQNGRISTFTADLDVCQSDDLTTFGIDGGYLSKVGTNNCNGSNADKSGTWEWTNNEQVLSISINGYTFEYQVLSLTNTTLKTKIKMPYDSNGDGRSDVDTIYITTFTAN